MSAFSAGRLSAATPLLRMLTAGMGQNLLPAPSPHATASPSGADELHITPSRREGPIAAIGLIAIGRARGAADHVRSQ
jgi:hypothetical protein